MIIDHNFM